MEFFQLLRQAFKKYSLGLLEGIGFDQRITVLFIDPSYLLYVSFVFSPWAGFWI
jgi:hypothetical protein